MASDPTDTSGLRLLRASYGVEAGADGACKEPNPVVAPDSFLFFCRLSLSSQTVTAYGAQTPLQPGMTLEADVALERRRLFEWMLDPLYAVTGAQRV